jgi:DNA primase
VREAARRAGIVIPEGTGRAGPDPREPLFEAVAVAQDWFTRRLLEAPDGADARAYLEGREIPVETAGEHGLGYAPGGAGFLAAMKELGVDDKVLLEAGLTAQRDDGRVVARFRSRLLFPIHDLRGRVVGFGGRLLGPGEPKYLNSPETPIFHKGKQLYNLHQAKSAIRKEDSVVLVEGFFDVFRLVLAGVEHVVAPLGTALTGDQAGLLRRFARTATLLYDSDQAGLRATFRAGDELLRHGVRVRVATMPEGEDPDSLVRKGGAAALQPILEDGIDLLERKIQLLERKGWFEGVEHQREALDRLLPTIRAAADPITRDLYLKTVSERTGVSREVLREQAAARPAPSAAPAVPPPDSPDPGRGRPVRPFGGRRRKQDSELSAERLLLWVLLRDSSWLAKAAAQVPVEWIETPVLRELYEAMLRSPENVGSAIFLEQLSPLARKAVARIDSIEAKYGVPDLDQAYVDACRSLEVRPLRKKLAEVVSLRQSGTLTAENFDSVVREERELRDQLSAIFPEELLKRKLRRGDIDAR